MVDASSVRAYGPGLDPKKCRAGVPVQFKIDATQSAKAPLNVNIQTDRGPLPKKPEVIDNHDGTYSVYYIPPAENTNLKTQILWNGKDIPYR